MRRDKERKCERPKERKTERKKRTRERHKNTTERNRQRESFSSLITEHGVGNKYNKGALIIFKFSINGKVKC